MKKFLFLLLLSLASAAVADEGDDPKIPKEIPNAQFFLMFIQEKGPELILDRFLSSPKMFREVCTKIESGDAEWLQVARQLRPVCDERPAAQLDRAVAIALPKAPGDVLALTGNGFAVDKVCTNPFPKGTAAKEAEREYLLKTETALKNLTAPELAERRDACLTRVQALLAAVK